MASIVKRGKKYVVVYYYTDEEGVRRQKWEPPVATKKEAERRLHEIQHEMDIGTFIPPSCISVKDFLAEFVEIYGTEKWGLSVYTSNTGLIRNYVVPLIGDCLVQDMDARVVDRFIHSLQKTKSVEVGGRKPHSEYVTASTVHKVCKLMHTAFKQAVRWGMIGRNPFEGAVLPKHEKRRRAIWDAATIRRALDACEDGKLYIAINLAFACSLRLGEICGLTWDCLHITDEAILNDNAYLLVEKILARVSKEAVQALGTRDILFAFPATMAGLSTTQLVLKKPKTESSIRKVWIPKTLAQILQKWKVEQDKLRDMLGDDYLDYGLVIALDNGRPCEERVIGNAFNRLKAKVGLPDVVFHSLRHSSTGDRKAAEEAESGQTGLDGKTKGRCLGKVGFSGQDFGGGSPENQKPSGAYRPSQCGAFDPASHCRIGSRGSRIHRTGLALYQAAHFLPRKEKSSRSYIRGFLYPALERFAASREKIRYRNCVVVFRHVYDRNRPEREYRDHDNIELNAVVDAIAMFFLVDDTPLECRHYYCSAAGDRERTEVYLVPRPEINLWLDMEDDPPGIRQMGLENEPICHQKNTEI